MERQGGIRKLPGWQVGLIAAAAVLGSAIGTGLVARGSAQEPVDDNPIFPERSIQQVASGFIFTEGPAWDGERLIFSDIPGDGVHVIGADGTVSALYAPSMMANGHTFDREGRLLNAEHASGAITRWTPEGGRKVVVEAYRSKHLNSPNDVVVRSDGMILFTDPPYGLGRPYQGVERKAELDFSGVFAFDEASGAMVLIDGELNRPNGLAFSPDETVLYVSDTATQKLWAYDIAADGTATNKRLFADLTLAGAEGSVDGVRVDTEGRVYTTCPGGVCVLTPEGALIVRLETPKRATNIAWGGKDLSDLYITALSDVYRIRTRARGTGSSSRR